MAGVYVAVIVIGLAVSIIFEKVPLVELQVPAVALPVSVPTTTIDPLEQTDWVVGFTTTPVNKFTLRYLLAVEISSNPHGFTALTLTI